MLSFPRIESVPVDSAGNISTYLPVKLPVVAEMYRVRHLGYRAMLRLQHVMKIQRFIVRAHGGEPLLHALEVASSIFIHRRKIVWIHQIVTLVQALTIEPFPTSG